MNAAKDEIRSPYFSFFTELANLLREALAKLTP